MENANIIKTRMVQKHDIEQNWNDNIITPLQGELIIYDADEIVNYPRIKIGNGSTTVDELPYVAENISIEKINEIVQGSILDPLTQEDLEELQAQLDQE